jgi:hemoglobin
MHSGNGDLSDLNRRFLACFVQAVDDAQLPTDPEFRCVINDFTAWAIGEVSGRVDGDDVPDDVPTPRWTWDGPAVIGRRRREEGREEGR